MVFIIIINHENMDQIRIGKPACSKSINKLSNQKPTQNVKARADAPQKLLICRIRPKTRDIFDQGGKIWPITAQNSVGSGESVHKNQVNQVRPYGLNPTDSDRTV